MCVPADLGGEGGRVGHYMGKDTLEWLGKKARRVKKFKRSQKCNWFGTGGKSSQGGLRTCGNEPPTETSLQKPIWDAKDSQERAHSARRRKRLNHRSGIERVKSQIRSQNQWAAVRNIGNPSGKKRKRKLL